MKTTEATIRNRDYALQIMNENLAHLQEPYTLKEYVELEAENDPTFFYWLFPNSENINDFGAGMTDEQIEEYQEFINSI